MLIQMDAAFAQKMRMVLGMRHSGNSKELIAAPLPMLLQRWLDVPQMAVHTRSMTLAHQLHNFFIEWHTCCRWHQTKISML